MIKLSLGISVMNKPAHSYAHKFMELTQKVYFLEYSLSQFQSVFKSWSAAP